jgi:hypothetical protein
MRLLLCAIFLVACGAGPNTAYLPVGSRCTTSSDCGTSPFDCDTTAPGGYCERACSVEADCPPDSTCGGALGGSGHCRRRCDYKGVLNECRDAEGYVCGDVGSLSGVTGCRTAAHE